MRTTKASTDLSIKESEGEDGTVVSLKGRLTIESSPSLRDRLLATLHRPSLNSLTIDLADVPYMDGSGVATLIEALKVARAGNKTLRLSGLQDRVHYLLEVTGLLPLFQPGRDESIPSVATTI